MTQQISDTPPTDTGALGEVFQKKPTTGHVLVNAENAAPTPLRVSPSYKWPNATKEIAGSRGSERRSSCLTVRRPSTLPASGCISSGRKKESLLRRFLLLQRQQLLSAHRLRLLPANLQVEALLGEGASGRVWRVRHKQTGSVFALKVIRKGKGGPCSSACARLYAERHVLIRGGLSRHLVQLHAAFQDEQHVFLMQEWAPGPSLRALVQNRGPLPEEEARRYAAQLALAIHAIHRLGFIHRDIKPENSILDKHGDLKLIDLGLAARPNSKAFPSSPGDFYARKSPLWATTPTDPNAALECCSVSSPGGSSGSVDSSVPLSPIAAIGGSTERAAGERQDFTPKTEASRTEEEGSREASPTTTPEASAGSERMSPEDPPESFAAWRLRQLWAEGARSAVGTLHYMAPEVALNIRHSEAPMSTGNPGYGKKADWWSFGAVLFECLFGHPPLARFNLAEMLARSKQPKERRPHLLLYRQERVSQECLNSTAAGREASGLITTVLAGSPRSPTERSTNDSLAGGGEDGAGAVGNATTASDGLPLSCELISNPELLLCTLRSWRQHLRIPPSPFVVSKGHEASKKPPRGGNNERVISSEAVDLLCNLLCEEERRFGFSRIRQHPWFKSINWEEEGRPPETQRNPRAIQVCSRIDRRRRPSRGTNSYQSSSALPCITGAIAETLGRQGTRDYETQANKWLLDLRFLGFEFDRRRREAAGIANRLRTAYDEGQETRICTLGAAGGKQRPHDMPRKPRRLLDI
ncbi:hypothetical protein cyc_04065 [Cyclospora cayetanensis]|uniref:non-specific serine/threonine protein kinase n=1 Tax=Cyclospora cayetanensis TaxID=88456 RepID=A0A1D3D582_9EIME|nr:hypothetical protein cyc_04065 [Cyclospora cayetanensis]